jgi:hypothetical protein
MLSRSTLHCIPRPSICFNDALIGRVKRGAYLVNTARGKICDRDAVARALGSGQPAEYTGDVWFPQPAPKDHPWRTMPHQGMTPHVSGTRLSAQARYAAGVREILECWIDGHPVRDEYVAAVERILVQGLASGLPGVEPAASFKTLPPTPNQIPAARKGACRCLPDRA